LTGDRQIDLSSDGRQITSFQSLPRIGYLMQQQLDAGAGAILKTSMEKLGVKVLLKKSTAGILGEDRVLGLPFADGHTLECDMVVISAGIKANWEIAAGCGLATERGIVVDDQMRTEDRDIYAVGEYAQHRGQTYGLVAPLWEQAKVLADCLTEKNIHAAYHGSKVATKLTVMGIEVASMGIVDLVTTRTESCSSRNPSAAHTRS
jgi:nitrite reductase (NADH) large subunit